MGGGETGGEIGGLKLFKLLMETKSRQRVSDHGEVFTAERNVKAVLGLVKLETEPHCQQTCLRKGRALK
jgi:hypothetical protein